MSVTSEPLCPEGEIDLSHRPAPRAEVVSALPPSVLAEKFWEHMRRNGVAVRPAAYLKCPPASAAAALLPAEGSAESGWLRAAKLRLTHRDLKVVLVGDGFSDADRRRAKVAGVELAEASAASPAELAGLLGV